MLTRADYQNAMLVQDACNLSGVVRSWAKTLEKVWDDARERGEGTSYVNEHPINVLYASKIAALTGCEHAPVFSQAYNLCQDRIKEMERWNSKS